MSHLPARYPLAITMWDFSWLERRWPGAGYESWDEALDGLVERGYDAVRIDAYPHLVAEDGRREWELLPPWTQNVWGAPARCRVRVLPGLIRFIAACARRGLKVGLSTWFRKDIDDIRMRITTPERLAEIWRITLDQIRDAGLLDQILYVDLCNEFPLRVWSPFVYNTPDGTHYSPAHPVTTRWMNESIAALRMAYPDVPLCFSLTHELEDWRAFDVSQHDLLEVHVWMTAFSDFYARVGWQFDGFDPINYDRLQQHGLAVYQSAPEHWEACLRRGIDLMAEWSRAVAKPLITTECWAIVDYKDFPLLPWDWVKHLCAAGVERASASGRWAALATSNFCGPQFAGMWRDVAWHRTLTDVIHHGSLPALDM